MLKRFKDQVVVITGGGTGIGKAAAIRFASEGAKVIIANRSEENARGTLGIIQEAQGQGTFVKTDVGSSAEIQALIQKTIDLFQRIDIIVHSAALESLHDVVTLPEDEWDRTINVNLKASYLLGKYAFPHMILNGGGAMINVASVHAHATLEQHAAYTASKGGLIALTRSMAIDFAKHNIRVNAILPGTTNTDMLNRLGQLLHLDNLNPSEDWKNAQPIGRLGEPEEVANLICFLASDEAKFIIGSSIVIDGGNLAHL